MASAFVLAYHAPTGTFLAQLRSRQVSNPRRWCLPGGSLNEGEKPKAGARREFYEEVGLRPGKLKYLGRQGKRHLYLWVVNRRFRAQSSAKSAWESARHAWFPLSKPPKPTVPWVRWMFKAARKELKGETMKATVKINRAITVLSATTLLQELDKLARYHGSKTSYPSADKAKMIYTFKDESHAEAFMNEILRRGLRAGKGRHQQLGWLVAITLGQLQ
jgi:8-oxo-dGTP pyrophosphatase MutT (NUDIX family)